MTTGPDSDRTGSGNGQETPDLMAALRRSVERPAPQQPPAQEREVWAPTVELTPEQRARADAAPWRPAPPSEADSAGEDEPYDRDREQHAADLLRSWADAASNASCPPAFVARMRTFADMHERHALAASSGVRGGDGEARERVAAEVQSQLYGWLGDRTSQADGDAWTHEELSAASADLTPIVLRAAGGSR